MRIENITQPRSSTESTRCVGLRSPALRGMLATWFIILAGILGAGAALANVPGDSVATSPKPGVPACDPNWTVVPSANPGGVSNHLVGLATVTANNIWAVGDYSDGSVARTLVEHWDGTIWTIVSSPNQGASNNYLKGVAAVSANNVWAVGNYVNGTGTLTLVEHWDGTAWTVVPSPNQGTQDNYLNAVAAVSANDVWAVGARYNTAATADQTQIEHWNGATWTVVPSPNQGGSNNDLYGVATVSANDVWAVGRYRDMNVDHTLTEHWDGSNWAFVSSPNQGPYDNALYAVAALSTGDVWAAGYNNDSSGTNQALTEHWNGTAWTVVFSPSHGSGNNNLYGIATVSPGDVWSVGSYQNGSTVQTLVEHWDGTAWSIVPSPNPGVASDVLNGAIAVSASDVWAVGSYYFSTVRTLVERYNPCPPTPTPTTPPLPTSTVPSSPTSTLAASPTPTPGSCAIHFSDVPPGSTFYDFVRCLACRGIVSGYADGTFRPGNNVTRGQLSKIVSNAAGFNDPQTVQMFEDVLPGSSFFNYIGRLASRGYMGGYPCGGAGEPCNPPGNLPYFRPNNNATRGQIAKIDSNAAQYSDPPADQQFEDVPVASTYYTYTYRLASRSVMSGYQCGALGEPCVPPANLPYFRPNNNATRGQTSKIVSNTFFPGCQTPRR